MGQMASINVLRKRWFVGSEGGDCENTCESDYFGLRMNVELADKQDANIMSICSLLIYWKKILGLPRILSFLIWIGGIRSEREFRQIELRGFGGGGVDKIRAFHSFFVYFGDRAEPFWRWR